MGAGERISSMAEKRNWFKELLEWLHHVYWIREFLISSGIAMAVMKWIVSHVGSLSQYGWAIWLLLAGLLMYLFDFRRRLRLKHRKSEDDLVIPQSKIEQILGPIFEDAKGAGAQAAMLWLFEAWSRDLIQRLEEAWDHWNYAGENLIHPLDARLDKLDFSKETAHQLTNDRRDFMVEYAAHLRRITADFPGFSSFVTTSGYPCDLEYRRVLNGLRSHSEKLEEYAERIWKSETPDSLLQETTDKEIPK
jgi:hypothetical protein